MHYYTVYLSINYKICNMYKTWRLELRVSTFQHITPVLCELHWLSIQYGIILKIVLLVCKSLNVTSPCYLAQKLLYRSHTRSLRSVRNEFLMLPRSYSKTYGDRTFAVHAPREWNVIRNEIRKSNTISVLKDHIRRTCLHNLVITDPCFYIFVYIP